MIFYYTTLHKVFSILYLKDLLLILNFMFFTIIIIVIFYFLSIYFSLCLNLSVLSYLPLCVASPSGINKGLFYLILLWNIVYVLYRQ